MFNENQAMAAKYVGEMDRPLAQKPLKERLRDQLAATEIHRQKTQRIVELLEKNPDLEELLNLMRETGYGY